MIKKPNAAWFLLFVPLVVIFVLGATCRNDDDDDDDNSEDLNRIEAVMEEVMEGHSKRTEEALDELIMPHISGEYDYAGLDRDGFRENYLDELDNDDSKMTITGYEAQFGIALTGDRAEVKTDLANQIKLELTDAEITLFGQSESVLISTLKREDDDWRLTAIASGPGTGAFDYGEKEFLPSLSADFAVAPTDTITAGGEIELSGTLTLPDLADDDQASAEFALDWNRHTQNLFRHDSESEVLYSFDVEEAKGTIDLAAVLPTDGRPAGLNIPSDLPPGADTIGASFSSIVFRVEDNEFIILGAALRFWNIPLNSFTNNWSCQNKPQAGPQGIWRLDFTEIAWISYPLLLDLTVVGDEAFASMLWALDSEIQGDPPNLMAIPLEGDLDADGFDLSFSFADDECEPPAQSTLSWSGAFDGTGITEGDFRMSRCGVPATEGLAFDGGKVTDRCDYIPSAEDAQGEWTLTPEGESGQTWTLTYDENGQETNYQLSGDGKSFTGLFYDNRLYAVNNDDPADVIGLIFDDDRTGFFFRLNPEETGGTLTRAD